MRNYFVYHGAVYLGQVRAANAQAAKATAAMQHGLPAAALTTKAGPPAALAQAAALRTNR